MAHDLRFQACPVLGYRVDNFGMQIGELARAVGVNIQTIRFYEREKLLPAPPRTASGYRDYSKRDLDRVLFIRRNHQIGFTLTEISQLLDLHAALEDMPRPLRRKPKQVKSIIALGRQRLAEVNAKISILLEMQRQLEFLITHLDGTVPITCPVSTQQEREAGRPSSRPNITSPTKCTVNTKAVRR